MTRFAVQPRTTPGPVAMPQNAGVARGQFVGGANEPDLLQLMLQNIQGEMAAMRDGPDPNNAFEPEITPTDLGMAVRMSKERLQAHCDVRTECLARFAGNNYPNSGIENKQYVNLLQQTVETLIPQLVSFEPRAHVEPIAGGLMVEAMIRELSLNRASKRANLSEIHFNWVMDALFSPFGIIRTGLKAGQEQVTVGDKSFIRGEFYCENIDFEDYVVDQGARKDGEKIFEGHRIRVPRSVALAAERAPGVPLYNRDVIATLPRLTLNRYLRSDADKLSGKFGNPYALVDMIELWEIAVYMGDRTMIYTLGNLGGQEWARDPYEYWGPQDGPYIKLWFTPMPSNILPISYASRIMDLHDAGAVAAARYIDQLERTKVVNVYRPGEEDLANACQEADDSEWIPGDPTAVLQVKTGGMVPELQPGIQFIMDAFNNASGAGQLIGGTKDISKTATAATILQGNAQARLSTMSNRSMRGLSKVFEHMAWYQDSDPMLEESLLARMPGGVRVELQNSPKLRKGDFSQFIFGVDAYSAKPMDPAVRLDKLVQGLGILFESTQLGPQGFSKVAQIVAKELQIPEIDDINPDPTAAMARAQLVRAEGPVPKSNPTEQPSNVTPQPFSQVQRQVRGTVSRANGPGAAGARVGV